MLNVYYQNVQYAHQSHNSQCDSIYRMHLKVHIVHIVHIVFESYIV